MADRPEDLPQRFDVWQADARPLTLPGLTDALPAQPWAIAVASRTDDQVLAYELARETPDAATLWEVLRKAMLQPETSDPHRPTEVQVCHPAWCEELSARLATVNVTCSVVQALEEIDEVFRELGGEHAVQAEPG